MPTLPLLGRPLLEEAQAGAVEPVNALLSDLALWASLRIASATTTAEPAEPAATDVWFVPAGATGTAWAGNAGKIAWRSGGAWAFAAPPDGIQAVILDEGRLAVWSAAAGSWVSGLATPGGVSFGVSLRETVLPLTGAAPETAPDFLPAGAILCGVRSEVVEAVTGATSFSVGRPGATTDYGTGLAGLAPGSVNQGVVDPFALYAAAPVVVTAAGGAFTGGSLRLTAALIAFG